MHPLEAENARLRDRVTELETVIGITSATKALHMRFRLLALLIARPIVTQEAAFAALYGDRLESEQPNSDKIFHVMICKLRKELKPHGGQIFTRYGQGYFLTAQGKAVARQFLSGLT